MAEKKEFSITDHGTLVGFTPLTPDAKAWIDDNVISEAHNWMGSTLYVEHRYANDLIDGLSAEGMI